MSGRITGLKFDRGFGFIAADNGAEVFFHASEVRGVPFLLVLHAEGPQAASFQGMVTLSINKGTITPSVAGPFVGGMATVLVVLEVPAGPSVVITATDDQGHQGSSHPFWVRPF